MGSDYAYMADGVIPSPACDKWLASPAVDDGFKWPSKWKPDPGVAHGTVREVMDHLANTPAAKVAWENGAISIRAVVDAEQTAWLDLSAGLAIAFRQLARFGGTGTLTMVSFETPDIGFRVEANTDGTSSCVNLGPKDVAAVQASSAYRETMDVMSNALDDITPPAKKTAARKKASSKKATAKAAKKSESAKSTRSKR